MPSITAWPRRISAAHIVMFLTAWLGGYVAYRIGMPMPFLIGGVIGAGIFIAAYERPDRKIAKLNRLLRPCAIATIGAMIGSKVDPGLLSVLPAFWISALAIFPFVVLAHAGGYAILRHAGKYSRTDAYFAAMPGGLVEALLLGEKAGADTRILTIQHFIRVVSVVVIVPLLFYLVTGKIVGSAAVNNDATQTLVKYGYSDIGLIFILAAVGLAIGRATRLPASHLLGPMILAVLVSVTGTASIEVPPWLLHTAQWIVGATLGAQFSGINRDMLRKCFGMGVLTVTYMLLLGFIFALALAPLVPAGVSAMFVSFAAGGLAEMSLIALSFELSPVVVALHHLIRIFMTLSVGNIFYKWWFLKSS